MNNFLVIAALLILLLILAVLLLLQVQQKREYLDFLRNIHAAIGLPFEKNPDVVAFMDQLSKINAYQSPENVHGPTLSIPEFLCLELDKYYAFMHATFHQETADQILQEGFKFEDNLYKTTHKISSDPIDLKYKIQLGKQHGNFLLLLNIPQELYDSIVQNIQGSSQDFLPECLISEKIDEDEMNFLFPSQFVRGYVNVITGEPTENDAFMKDFNSDAWKRKIHEKIKSKK